MSKQRLQLGEDLLDRVEVGAVGGEIEQAHAGGFEALADVCNLVGGKIVAHHDGAGLHFGDEMLDQPLVEDAAGHRSIDEHRCQDAVVLQAGDEGRGHPVTMGRLAQERLALLPPAISARHIGRGAGLVDKDERGEVKLLLRRAPDLAGNGDIQPALLSREDRDFFYAAAPGA